MTANELIIQPPEAYFVNCPLCGNPVIRRLMRDHVSQSHKGMRVYDSIGFETYFSIGTDLTQNKSMTKNS